MEPELATNILPVEIWAYILAFLKPSQEFMPAMVCSDFYEILKARRNKRNETVWTSDMEPFCKTVDWAKFIISTVGMGLQSHASGTPVPLNLHPPGVGLELSVDGTCKNRCRYGFTRICNKIKTIALLNNYYETYKHMAFLESTHSLQIESLLQSKNYTFIINIVKDGMPLDMLCSYYKNGSYDNSIYSAIELIINTNDLVLIENVLKSTIKLDTYKTVICAIKTHNINTLNTVINICTQAYLSDISKTNVITVINYYMESYIVDVNDIKFMCEEYGYVYPSHSASASVFHSNMYAQLEEMIKYGCPVTHELESVLYILLPKLYAMLKPSQIVYTENQNEPGISKDNSFKLYVSKLRNMHQNYGTKLVIPLAQYALKTQNMELMTYLIEYKCQITKEIDDYLRINMPGLYAQVDPSTINYNVEPLSQVFVNELLRYEEIQRMEMERERLEMEESGAFGLFD